MPETFESEIEAFGSEAVKAMDKAARRFTPDYFKDALDLVAKSESEGGRLHITGIGKPHHVANYMASLFSSTGTPCYFLDGTEATHGSAGQVKKGDTVIALSYFGNVAELVSAVRTLKRNGARIISVTGFPESEIALLGDVHLDVHVEREGDYLNRPPRISMLVSLFMLMSFSLILQTRKGIDQEAFIRWHPSGQLGREDRP